MNSSEIIKEVHERFGEWIEQAGSERDQLTITLLCELVILEREKNKCLQKTLDTCTTSNNSSHT